MLKYYASTNKEGTVGDILEALLDLGFLPALHQAQQHISGKSEDLIGNNLNCKMY